jgi:hypothetical protein
MDVRKSSPLTLEPSLIEDLVGWSGTTDWVAEEGMIGSRMEEEATVSICETTKGGVVDS